MYDINESEKSKYREKYELDIKMKYEQSKAKYKTREFDILETYETKHYQSFHQPQKVKVQDKNGNVENAFHKGASSGSEYELLISRIGKAMGIPVAEVSLYLENKNIEGISVSCVPDEEKYEFILGYDFVQYDNAITDKVKEIKSIGKERIPVLDNEGIKYYIEAFFKGLELKDIEKSQIEDIKKDFLTMTLFNTVVDEKDFNYANFALLKNKEENSYQMAPLFDNGNVKRIEEEQGTMIVGIGRAQKDNILDVLYSEYYDYIQEFSKKLAQQKEAQEKHENNIIDKTMEIVDDTLQDNSAIAYKKTVTETLEKIVIKEREKNKDKNVDVLDSAIKSTEEVTKVSQIKEQLQNIKQLTKSKDEKSKGTERE